MNRILVIGGGSIGERHVRCFLRTGRVTVSLCEIRDDIRDRLQTTYTLEAVYADLDQTANDAFDAAVICTPANLHIPMALRLAERGLHLLIEKPLSTSTRDCDSLGRLRDSRELIVAVAYILRGHPVLIALRHHLDRKTYGRPVQVVSQSGQHFPFYRPAYRETYYVSHDTGGGAIQDALTHALNAVEWLVGPITKLAADADHCVLNGTTVEDTVHVITRHGDVLGNFNLNQHQPAMENFISIVCDRGILRADLVANRLLVCDEPDGSWQTIGEFPLERDDLFVRQAEAFLDSVCGRSNECCGLEEGLQTLRVNLATLRSVQSRQWVDITNE